MRRDERSENSALRHQLEGGLEVLEAAASRYRELTATLLGTGWKRRLRRTPTLVAAMLAQEPSLPEVLTRLQQRAEREPERSGPASRFLRQFEEERTKLWRAMGQRLELNDETLSLSQGPLTGRLERIRDLVLKRPLSPARHPILPGASEFLLLEGNGVLQPLVAALVLLFPWLLLALPVLSLSDNSHPMAWSLVVALSAACWAFCHMRSGHYWLTPERLVWQPRWGLPVELPLSSLRESTVTVSTWGSVTVDALGGITLGHVPHAARLASLLSIRRRKEFHDAGAVRNPQRLIAVLTMGATRPGEPVDTDIAYGWTAVLRPSFVAFFRSDVGGAMLLNAMTEPSEPPHTRERLSIPFTVLLEELSCLPEARMDAMLRKAASVLAGAVWEARELKWRWRGEGDVLELSQGDKAVLAKLSWRENQAAQQVIAQWTALQQMPQPLEEVAQDEGVQEGMPVAAKRSTPPL